ncbi:electron transfer flavoprotein beta subunit [Halopolyspora algeriensis]|uniref:Electron transfer flavoprotein subunit beta n=1 Tax=Halopolyspora algeriensis TaxID=1500506 RepID=A0A368VTV4_9ACTN|nr:electron transfer flavoprotein subunit beta/FixA family protein [Halopolyspora algeriensis]RCW45185.1 electron transfer flavoprotein beta subunit [Halopolyspora algeriensis]TQM53096.1 electron transfer flavoprotein beta subunit [Halopolyspora algeriensis]
MNIVVLVKQVPDTWSERKLSDADHTLDRASADAVLDEINERAVEEALLAKEAQGGEVTVVCMGPERANEAIRKALSMGADSAVHVSDEALHGSDAVQTARTLAAAIGTLESVDLVIAGNESTDGRAGAVPAMVAELLGWPQLTYARKLDTDGQSVSIERESDAGVATVEANLPALVSVTEKINEPRYPSFKGIMAAKKKPVSTLSVADVGLSADEVGLGSAPTQVVSSAPAPPKEAGVKVTDEGEGGVQIVEFLSGQKLV